MKLKGKKFCNVIACYSFQPPVCHLPCSSKLYFRKGHCIITLYIVTRLCFLALTFKHKHL